MSIKQVVAVRDGAVEAFLQPVFVDHVGGAVREFNSAVNDDKHEFHAHAQDYSIHHLGEFDLTTGVFSPPEGGIQRLSRAVDVKLSKS